MTRQLSQGAHDGKLATGIPAGVRAGALHGALEALRDACFNNDPALIQGSTTTPPPLLCLADWPVEAGCMIGYCGWKGEGLALVGQVEEYWAGVCREADNLLGEPAACRWLLNWFDETPREEVLRELFRECELALEARRKAGEAA